MEGEPEIIEKPPTSGETVWDMEASSVLLDSSVRSPQSLQVDDNNKLYIGVTDGVYIMNLKKIANRKVFTENVINVNDLLKKHFSKETINIILKDFNQKSRENQERNYTTTSMLRYRFRISSIMESKLILKAFRISPNGLLPGNESIMALLLNIDTLILMGKISQNYVEQYVPLTNCDMLTQGKQGTLPIFFNTHCFTWIEYNKDDQRMAFLVVYYENVIEFWVFKYYSILNPDRNWEFKRILKEEYNETASVMTGGVDLITGGLDVLVNGPGGKINKLSYELGFNEDLEQMTMKRSSLATFQTHFQDVHFIRILPSHLTPDDSCLRFIYGAQNHCFVGGFDEEQSNDCIYSHNFPANLSELIYYDNGIEFMFMDGANVNYDLFNNDAKINRKQGIYGIFGGAYSSTQILKILIGPPSYFALRNTNLLVLSNVSEKSPYFDIIYQMSNKVITNLIKREGQNYRLYTTKKPLNFSDILMLFATNQVNYRQFLKAYFATYDESLLESKSKKKAELKDLLKGINSEIVEKFNLSPEVKNHVAQAILLNLLYFAPEFFKDSVNRLMNKAILGFYSSMVLWYQEEAKGNEAVLSALYIKKIRSYLKQEEARDNMEVETGEGVDNCPICEVKLGVKETQCENGHHVLRCLLSRKVIYLQEYFECKLCKHKYLKECLESYCKQGIDLNFSCVICSNLLKKV